MAPNVTVVMATRNRRETALGTLGRLSAVAERPPIVVVDNASTDGTADAIRMKHAEIEVIQLDENLGAAARNVGVRRARTPYVAFSDDDSWWAPGSLTRAARLLEACPRLALVAARILVGPEGRLDPTCALMASSPLHHLHPETEGSAILGFLACGAILRRGAFLEAGGFCSRFGIGAEEELLAVDLAVAGWDLAYVEDVVAHHHPSAERDSQRRRRTQTRNAMWSAWLRRPAVAALRRTGRLLLAPDGNTPAALMEALVGLPWVLRNRRVVPPALEDSLRLVIG